MTEIISSVHCEIQIEFLISFQYDLQSEWSKIEAMEKIRDMECQLLIAKAEKLKLIEKQVGYILKMIQFKFKIFFFVSKCRSLF